MTNVVITDSSKLGAIYPSQLGVPGQIKVLITDDALAARDITWHCVPA